MNDHDWQSGVDDANGHHDRARGPGVCDSSTAGAWQRGADECEHRTRAEHHEECPGSRHCAEMSLEGEEERSVSANAVGERGSRSRQGKACSDDEWITANDRDNVWSTEWRKASGADDTYGAKKELEEGVVEAWQWSNLKAESAGQSWSQAYNAEFLEWKRQEAADTGVGTTRVWRSPVSGTGGDMVGVEIVKDDKLVKAQGRRIERDDAADVRVAQGSGSTMVSTVPGKRLCLEFARKGKCGREAKGLQCDFNHDQNRTHKKPATNQERRQDRGRPLVKQVDAKRWRRDAPSSSPRHSAEAQGVENHCGDSPDDGERVRADSESPGTPPIDADGGASDGCGASGDAEVLRVEFVSAQEIDSISADKASPLGVAGERSSLKLTMCGTSEFSEHDDLAELLPCEAGEASEIEDASGHPLRPSGVGGGPRGPACAGPNPSVGRCVTDGGPGCAAQGNCDMVQAVGAHDGRCDRGDPSGDE